MSELSEEGSRNMMAKMPISKAKEEPLKQTT